MDATANDTIHNALKAVTLRNQSSSPLLRLPAEIRNQIYGYVFRNTVIQICDECPTRSLHTSRTIPRRPHAHYPRQLLGLLEVCRQIHAEARLVVFGEAGTRLQGYYESVTRYISSFSKNSLTADQTSSIKNLVLEFQDSDLYSNENDRAFDIADHQLGCIALLHGVEDIFIRIDCRYPIENGYNDGTEFQDSIASLRSQVKEMCRQHGSTVNVKIAQHRIRS